MKHQLANQTVGFHQVFGKSNILASLLSADDRHLHPGEVVLI
jgi:hypothetical protein